MRNNFNVTIARKLIHHNKKRIPEVLCYLLAALLPFDHFAVSPVIIILAISAATFSNKINWCARLKSGQYLYFPLIVFYLYHIVGLTWTSNYSEGLRQLEYKLSLFILPITISLIPLNQRKVLHILFIFTCINILIVIASFLHFFYIDLTQDEFIILGERIEGNRVGTRSEYLSAHFIITEQHRTFFSTLLVISVWFLLNYISRISFLNKKMLGAIIGGISILIAGILVIQSKLAYIMLLFTLIAALILYFKYISKKILVLALVATVIISLATKSIISSRLMKMIDELEYILADGADQSKTFTTQLRPGSSEIRYMIYKSSFQLIAEAPFFGFGTGDVKDKLTEQNYKNMFTSIAHLNYGTHSQFLHTGIAFGIIGLLLFCFIFILSVSHKLTMNDYFSTGIIIILCIACIFESYLNSRAGIVPFAFFISIIAVKNLNKPVTLFNSEPLAR